MTDRRPTTTDPHTETARRILALLGCTKNDGGVFEDDLGSVTAILQEKDENMRYHLWRLAYQYPYGYGTIDVTCDPGYEFPLSADDWQKIADAAIPNIRDTLVPDRAASGVIITAMTPLLRGK